MAKKGLGVLAFQRKFYATDGIEYIRVEPSEDNPPFIGFIKTGKKGEAKVPYNSTVLNEVLSSGKEINKDEYDSAEVLENTLT